MQLFLTDSSDIYKAEGAEFKCLLNGPLLVNSTWISDEGIATFNNTLNKAEFTARESMLSDLYEMQAVLSGQLFKVNRYLGTRSEKDIVFFLLHLHFRMTITQSHLFLQLIKQLLSKYPETNAIHVNLPEEYAYLSTLVQRPGLSVEFSFTFRKIKAPSKLRLLGVLKHMYYTFEYLIPKPRQRLKKPGATQTHFLFLLSDIKHHHHILKTFFKLCEKQKDIFITVVHVSSGIEQKHSASLKSNESVNFQVLNLQEFRSTKTIVSHSDFYNALNKLNPVFQFFKRGNLLYHAELKYAWIGKAFELLKPDVCLHIGVFNDGRYMSDVANFYDVPSVNLEYGISFDDPLLEANIEFTARAVPGQDAVDVWKKRKDPTPSHYIIGAPNLDEYLQLSASFNKASFFARHQLDPLKKTIFFAGTYSSALNYLYDIEKKEILRNLCKLCHENDWNLIVKKHPLEFDTIVDDVIAENNYLRQRAFRHDQVGLSEAVFYSDFITNQISSIVLEALYFNKPFCYLTTSLEETRADQMTMVKEGLAFKFHDMASFAEYASDIFNTGASHEIYAKINRLKTLYLYKTDGNASERLFELMLQLANKRTSC